VEQQEEIRTHIRVRETFNSLITHYQKNSITDSFQKRRSKTAKRLSPVMYCFFPFSHQQMRDLPKNRNNGILSTTLNQHPPGYLGKRFLSPLAHDQGFCC
jgi:hypothetical protein